MKVEVIAIGNELLNGDLADTNTQTLAAFLRQRGLSVACGQTVPDTMTAMTAAFALAAERADLVLVSGGLGPTSDDLTVAALAEFAGLQLQLNEQELARIKARFEQRGYPFTENNAKQAYIPEGAEALTNTRGTAPGVRLTRGQPATTFFLFPGVPHELKHLAKVHLAPWLEEHASVRPYHSATFKTFGKTESQVAALLDGMETDERVHIAYRASFPEIRVSVHVQADGARAATELLDRYSAEVRTRLGDLIFSEDPSATFAASVGEWLKGRGETIATAESCTGGLVAKMLTDVSGSSAYVTEGMVTYSNAAKTARLGVPAELIEEHGAVSEPVARAMAEGIGATAGTTYGVAITGVAGPTGGTDAKPVGTVHYAVCGPSGTWHRVRQLPFDRERNRIVSAYVVLDMVLRYPKKMGGKA